VSAVRAVGATPQDQVVVITGAAGGIGAALARRWHGDGARVALLDRDLDGARAVAAQLESGGGPVGAQAAGPQHAQVPGRALALACDVTSVEDCRRAVDAVVATWGGIDVLVNNAGITHLGRFLDTDVDVIHRVVDVNLFGAVHCTKAALPSLLARRGQVVVMSSVAGVTPLTGRTGYSAAKHALHGFFDTLRQEHHADGLRVMVVCPSFVDTAIGAHALGPDGGPAPAESRTGVKAPVSPELLAEAVVRAARRNQRLLLFPREARLAYWLARLSPRTYGALMRRRTGTLS
jgi:NAD(P)-dependent dehydrogenase (short-subunit alcohol dehydrogenase family)